MLATCPANRGGVLGLPLTDETAGGINVYANPLPTAPINVGFLRRDEVTRQINLLIDDT